jgi:HEAT repeat protein
MLLASCREPTAADLQAKPWLDALEHFQPEKRSEAIRKLAEQKYRPAARRIAKRINDIRPDVRLDAIHALGSLGSPASVQSLRLALSEPEWTHRRAAVVAMGTIGHESAIPFLVEALADRDQAVGRTAAETLAGFGAPAESPLLQTLSSGAAKARPNAAIALGLLKSAKARQFLRDALASADPSLRASAALALASTADTQDTARLANMLADPDPAVARAAAEAIDRIGATALHFMITATTNRNRQARLNAYRFLVAHPAEPGAVNAMLAGWDDPDETISRLVRSEFTAGGPRKKNMAESVKPQLLAALRSPSDRIRLRALESLAPVVRGEDTDALVALLADRSDAVRRRAIETLAGMRDERARAELRKLAGSGSEDARFLAAVAMTSQGDPEALAATIAFLESFCNSRTNASFRADSTLAARVCSAVSALGSSRDKRAIPVLTRMLAMGGEEHFGVICAAIASMQIPEAFDSLLLGARDRHWYWGAGRNAAIGGLARSDPKRAAQYYLDVLSSADFVFEDARNIMIGELAALSDPRAAACIAPYLVHDIEETRNAATVALAGMKGAAVTGLLACATSTNRSLRAAIAFTLAEIGPPALAPAREALRSPTPEVREVAAWTVGQMKDPGDASQLLVDRLGRDDSHIVRAACAWALGQLKAQDRAATDELGVMLRKDPAPSCRQTAAFALGEIAPTSAVPALVEALADQEYAVRAVAAGALGRIGTPPVVEHLRRTATGDPAIEVRSAANNALIAMGQPAEDKPGRTPR